MYRCIILLKYLIKYLIIIKNFESWISKRVFFKYININNINKCFKIHNNLYNNFFLKYFNHWKILKMNFFKKIFNFLFYIWIILIENCVIWLIKSKFIILMSDDVSFYTKDYPRLPRSSVTEPRGYKKYIKK